MPRSKKGPIERFSWGRFIIEGREHSENGQRIVGAGKDIRLIGRNVSEWQERQGHRLKQSMVTGIYDHDVETLVIGIGVESRVKVPKKVLKAIHRHGISRVLLRPTPKACKTFNRLFRKGKRVALLAHGTC
jgi:hypothetical protein